MVLGHKRSNAALEHKNSYRGLFNRRKKNRVGNVDKTSCAEVRASQLAQASERVGSLIPASQQG